MLLLTLEISGKSIALRLARDGYDICVNDVKANEQGANEVSCDGFLFQRDIGGSRFCFDFLYSTSIVASTCSLFEYLAIIELMKCLFNISYLYLQGSRAVSSVKTLGA